MTLSCTGVSIDYGKRRALSDFSFMLEAGRIHGLIGPNGSGKSTALQALAGLIKPTRGDVELDGRRIGAMARRQIARRLAFLPQQPAAPEEMTVAELARQARFAHVGLISAYGPRDEAAIAWALESTGLVGLADRGLQELSGGERQRAWIAAALAQEAQILLLDEPTSYLDIGYQVEILDLIHRLSRDKGVSIVMAIHDINQAIAVCDRIALLDGGRLAFDGEPRALAASGLVESVFRVSGTFVEIAPGAPPHLDIALARPGAGRRAD